MDKRSWAGQFFRFRSRRLLFQSGSSWRESEMHCFPAAWFPNHCWIVRMMHIGLHVTAARVMWFHNIDQDHRATRVQTQFNCNWSSTFVPLEDLTMPPVTGWLQGLTAFLQCICFRFPPVGVLVDRDYFVFAVPAPFQIHFQWCLWGVGLRQAQWQPAQWRPAQWEEGGNGCWSRRWGGRPPEDPTCRHDMCSLCLPFNENCQNGGSRHRLEMKLVSKTSMDLRSHVRSLPLPKVLEAECILHLLHHAVRFFRSQGPPVPDIVGNQGKD